MSPSAILPSIRPRRPGQQETDELFSPARVVRPAARVGAVAVHGAAAGFDERPTRLLGHLFVEIFLGGSLAGRRGLHGFLAELLGEVVVFGSRNESFRLLAFALRVRAVALCQQAAARGGISALCSSRTRPLFRRAVAACRP